MEINDLKDKILEIISSKKGFDTEAVYIGDKTSLCDYFIISSASNTPQLETIYDEVLEKVQQEGIEPLRTEGDSASNWMIIDYGDIIVHIFLNELREYYNLERLWKSLEEKEEE